MAERYRVTLISEVVVDVANPDVIERVTGPEGDEWREQLYPLHSPHDVVGHLAYNAARNGVLQASQLDGWADLDRTDSAEMFVDQVEVEHVEQITSGAARGGS